jgi:hypothetical protein
LAKRLVLDAEPGGTPFALHDSRLRGLLLRLQALHKLTTFDKPWDGVPS